MLFLCSWRHPACQLAIVLFCKATLSNVHRYRFAFVMFPMQYSPLLEVLLWIHSWIHSVNIG